MYEDVAQRVKKKYPGVYDNIPDSELGDKIVAKYPQYAQMGQSQPTEQSAEQPAKKGGVLKSIAGFLGVKNLGTGAAQVLATPGAVRTTEDISSQNADSVQRLIKRIQGEKDPSKKAAFRKILNKFIKETGDQPTATDLATDGEGFVSGRAVAGDAVQLATTLGTLGLSTGAGTTGKLVGATPTSMLQRIGLGAKAGAGFGAANATENAQSAGEAVGDVAKGTVAGAAVGSAVEGLTTGTKKVLAGTAENVYKRLIKTPTPEVLAGREQLGSGLLKRGVKGNYEQMANQVQTSLQENGKKIGEIVTQNADTPVNISSAKEALLTYKEKLLKTPGEKATAKSVQAIINDLGKDIIPASEAQGLKQRLQEAVGPAFLKDKSGAQVQAQKIAAREIAKAIETAIPDIKPFNKEYEFGKRAIKELVRVNALSPNKLRIMIEAVTGISGAFFNPAVTAGVIGERIASTPQVATRMAQTASKVAKLKLPNEVAQLLQRLGLFSSRQ